MLVTDFWHDWLRAPALEEDVDAKWTERVEAVRVKSCPMTDDLMWGHVLGQGQRWTVAVGSAHGSLECELQFNSLVLVSFSLNPNPTPLWVLTSQLGLTAFFCRDGIRGGGSSRCSVSAVGWKPFGKGGGLSFFIFYFIFFFKIKWAHGPALSWAL